ncbi:MAG: C1 family peptidase [Solobacterium sp.]|nr:C1 family peptidase [Solobacterium sp.]
MKSFRFSSSASAKLLKASLAAMLSFSGFSSSTILAEEETEQPEEIVSEEVSEEVPEEIEESPEELSEEPEEILEETALPEGKIIKEAEGIGFDEISKDTRPALEEILAELPATIRVRIAEDEESEGEWTEIPANWECLGDYEEERGVYVFVPNTDEYTVLLDAKLPYVTLIVGDPNDALMGGFRATELPFKVENPVSEGRLKGNYPAVYNNKDKMPAVRNQDPYGACWTFATMGAIEADLIHDGKADKSIDLSELQLAYFTTHDFNHTNGNFKGDSIKWKKSSSYLDNGGNYFISSAALANNIGPVKEADAPYSKGSSWTVPDSLAVSSNTVQVTDSYLIVPSELDDMKQAIIDHNGIAVSIFADKKYYSSTYNSYLCALKETNHAVMIVGWDDNFPRNNFGRYRAPHDGAWLVRNSWGGQGYSFDGYFWISYYDYGLNSAYAFAFEADTEKYDDVYAYNLNPIAEDAIELDKKEATVTQDFTVDAGEYVKAVNVVTRNADMIITVSATDGKNTTSGIISAPYFGCYTVKLDNPFKTTAKSKVTVTVKYKCDGSSALLIPYEEVLEQAYGGAIFTSSFSGPGFTLDGKHMDRDAMIKLYTGKNASPAPTGAMAMYRLYNPNSGEHFYTGNEGERYSLVCAGWKYEGIGFYAPQKSNTPMYRLYNPNAGDHHYTFSAEERNSLLNVGWKDEGIGWYSDDAKTVKMFRLYNPNAIGAGSHHYTSNNAERQNLIKIGWKDEDIGFYALQ